MHKGRVHGPCGTHPDDWDPEKGGHPNAWVAGEHHCKGCQRLEMAQELADKRAEKGDKPLRGTSVVLRRQEGVGRA